MALKEHPIFVSYPNTGTRTNWYGKVTTPYRVYDGVGAMIGGSCDVTAARHMLRGDAPLEPAVTVDRRALMVIWVASYHDASVGPHTELKIGLVSSRQIRSDVAFHPLMVLKVMAERPDLPTMLHAWWSDSERLVGYSRDMLGVGALLASSAVTVTGGGPLKFAFTERDDERGVPVAHGSLKRDRRTPGNISRDLDALFGGRDRARVIVDAPYSACRVLNRRSTIATGAFETELAFGHEYQVLRYWDPEEDVLTISHPYYSQIDFRPDFVQQFMGARVVHATPRELDPTAA
jgi:hypothetical protein